MAIIESRIEGQMIKVYKGHALRIAIGIMMLGLLVSGAEAAYPTPTDVTFQNSTWHWVPVKIVPVGGSGYDDYYPTQQWFGLRSLPASDTVPFTMDTPFNSEAYIEKDFDITSGTSSLSMEVFGARNINGWCGDPVTVTVLIIDSMNTLHQLGNFIPVQRDGNIGPGETKNFDTSNFGGQRIKVRISQTSSGQHCTYGNYRNIKIETLTSPASIQGIDVSGYQHPRDNPIDWAKVHDTGIEFAFAKADEGAYSTHYTDTYFKTDMDEGKANGILMGAYHFARPVSYSAKDEAEHFISTAKDYLKAGYLRPALDIEKYDYNGISEDPCEKMGKTELSKWVNEWMNIVKDKTDVEPILYTYSDYANRCFDSSVTNRDLWIADFRTVSSPGIKPWQKWAFWQYSDKGKVNGITSDTVDLDKFYGTKSELYNFIATPISTPGPAAIPINKKETLGPYGGGHRYYIHIYNVDDIAKAIVNGKLIGQMNYQQDSGWIEITNYLSEGKNSIEFNLENGQYGGWTYGFEIKQEDSNIIWKDSCGTSGTMGCMNNDGTRGLVYRDILTLVITPTINKGTKIAFQSTRDGNQQIYIMNEDGSGQTRLTRNTANDGYPAWSPDGRKIAFASDRTGTWQVFVMNADGGGQTDLTRNVANDGYPSWSPDGRKIVFASKRDSPIPDKYDNIYVMDADGSNVIRLTNIVAEDVHPAWSPDGQKIAFASDRDGHREIYIMNGLGLVKITNTVYYDDYPAWSPDGRKIAFASARDSHDSTKLDIYIMNADGTNVVRLTNNAADDRHPSWSQDSGKIAFASARDGKREIYVMNADGTGVKRLTNKQGDDQHPAFIRTYATPISTPVPIDTTGSMVKTPGFEATLAAIGILGLFWFRRNHPSR